MANEGRDQPTGLAVCMAAHAVGKGKGLQRLFFLFNVYIQNMFFLQSQEVQFFGAITLHSKLMKHWHEVPHGSRNELKQKILETIVQFASGPKLVLNRLCLAVSTLFALP